MKRNVKSSRQLKKIRDLREQLHIAGEQIADLKEQLEPKNTVAISPYDTIKNALQNKTALHQNELVHRVVIEMGVERCKEFEDAKFKFELATQRLEDFKKRYPSVIHYRPSINPN